jgi:hypothetical protein
LAGNVETISPKVEQTDKICEKQRQVSERGKREQKKRK